MFVATLKFSYDAVNNLLSIALENLEASQSSDGSELVEITDDYECEFDWDIEVTVPVTKSDLEKYQVPVEKTIGSWSKDVYLALTEYVFDIAKEGNQDLKTTCDGCSYRQFVKE